MSTLPVVLVVFWLLGIVTSYAFGGFIHLLLILAVAVGLARIVQRRNPIAG